MGGAVAVLPRVPVRRGDDRVRSRAAALVVAASGVALVVGALGLAVGGGAPVPASAGLPDAGPVTGWARSGVALATRVVAVVLVGELVVAGLLARAAPGGPPAVTRRALAAVPALAAAWCGLELLRLPLTASALLAVPVHRVPPGALLDVAALPVARPALAAALVLGVTALVAARARSARHARLLLVPVLMAAVLPVVGGHGAGGDGHGGVVWLLAAHVVAAAVWVGGVVGLLRHRAWLTDPVSAATRFSHLAVGCVGVVVGSGVASVPVLTGAGVGGGTGGLGALGVLGSGWGALLLSKVALLAVLVALGWWHRRTTLPLLRQGRPGAFRRLLGVEVVVMAATIGAAVALAASPPPAVTDAPAATTPTAPTAPAPAAPAPAAPVPAAPVPAAEEPAEELLADMSGHDHGDLSVGVLVDDDRFHVGSVASAGGPVTVYNQSTTEVTLTAADGSFDVVVPGRTLTTFTAPGPGEHRFTSRHDPAFADVLVVRGDP
ncbi:CopD family protein [Aquipuribacter nitratireducens]|uniref:CopD family protein n=1 Tax=Aquipuribacter nitratireducens TaxID=650104 RepID=A0ABW0GQR8_9MICO